MSYSMNIRDIYITNRLNVYVHVVKLFFVILLLFYEIERLKQHMPAASSLDKHDSIVDNKQQQRNLMSIKSIDLFRKLTHTVA